MAPLPGSPDATATGGTVGYIIHLKSNEATLSSRVIRRNPDQSISRIETAFSGAQQPPGRTQTFSYDLLGRLTGCVTKRREVAGGAVITESEVIYSLDPEGLRLSAMGGANPGSYSQSDALPPGDRQMGQYTSWPGGPLTWDESGNLATATIHGQSCQLQCSSGWAMAVKDGTGTPLVTYDYDALGRRTGRNPQTGSRTKFIYDGTTCVQEWEDSGSGSFKPALSYAACDGVQYAITTQSGEVFFPSGGQGNAMATWGDPHEGGGGKHVGDWNGRHSGDPHENLNGKNKVEHWGDPHENLNGFTLLTDGGGNVVDRFDCDDAGKPLFLGADGLPSATGSPVGPIRWMAPEAIWESRFGMFVGASGFFCPDLGMSVAGPGRPRGGHVTILK